MEPPFVVLRVTLTQEYVVPMADAITTRLDGRSLEDLKTEWFQRFPLYQSHATRDAHSIGNSEQVLSVEEVDSEGL